MHFGTKSYLKSNRYHTTKHHPRLKRKYELIMKVKINKMLQLTPSLK
jgi:hypothetical protein